jgi:16S rRNA (cytosine967-C5)-methyltransferase
MSVYQLMYMDQVPVSAVCNEAVKLAKKRSFTKLSGFVNGILRTIARNTDAIIYPDPVASPSDFLEIVYSTPKWLVEELLKAYPYAEVETMLAQALKEKETTIRCNTRRATPGELKSLLEQEGVSVAESAYLPYAFVIKDYDYLEKLDTFRKGYFTVQDVSSMLVCEVAGIAEEDFVIDVCAAPGGKALHAAQTAGRVLARDLTEYKIKLIEENISRMGFTNVTAQVWDATISDVSLEGKADVVIADLPCSGLGVFGKKADLKYKLTQSQHKELVELQRVILDKVEKYVKPGGVLMYSTCTVLRGENEENRDWFLKNYSYLPESLDPGLPGLLRSQTTKDGYLQLLQGVHNTDGFFIAKFRRKS